jgi:hypothetical protein
MGKGVANNSKSDIIKSIDIVDFTLLAEADEMKTEVKAKGSGRSPIAKDDGAGCIVVVEVLLYRKVNVPQ